MQKNYHKPSVMHVIDSLAVGGAERMLVDIANAIDEREFTISVCITRSGQALAHELHPSIPLRILNRKSRFDLNGFKGIRQFSREQNVDLYHAHSRSTFSFLLAARKLGFINKPIILHDHFGDIEFNKSVPSWFKNIGIHHVRSYIGVCDKLANWAMDAGISNDKVSVVENGLDFQRINRIVPINLHSFFDIPQKQKIGVVVGNIRPAKGLDLLIEACTELPQAILPIFVIVGKDADSDYAQSCRVHINDVGLAPYFRFAGSQESSIPWIKGADFGIVPSRSESGPLVLIEIMACGLPFVAFNVGGISQQVSQFLPGSFACPGDVTDFSTKLSRLLNATKDDLAFSSSQNKELAFRLFDIHNRVSKITSIYYSILKSAR